jgi:neutral ceramidase
LSTLVFTDLKALAVLASDGAGAVPPPTWADPFWRLDAMIKTKAITFFFATVVAVTAQAVEDKTEPAQQWKAGVATAMITPQLPLPMAGYAARKEPAIGTEQDLFAKALALQDGEGNRTVFITLDLIGVREELRAHVADQVLEKYQLPPEALLINASHTHCGPQYDAEEAKDYFDALKQTLVKLVGEALDRLETATLTYSHARCSVAMNRRTLTDRGYSNHPNPDGPVDHSVPVLSIQSSQGELRAVVFGYACHNTTMSFRKWLGDYAGYAQEYFEQDHPGVAALFMMGCGGDQNPYPRGELKYAQAHGRSLATAIEAALEVNQTRPLHRRVLQGPLVCALETVELDYTDSDRTALAYPIQVIRFGDDLTLVALASEVTVDYSLRLKFELTKPAGPAVWVAGYSNLYAGYIPSRRVLLEGGYEAASRPWEPTLEERIVAKVHTMIKSMVTK